MFFELTEEISRDILYKANEITRISNELNRFFKDKNYGEGVKSFYVGIICLHPDFDSTVSFRKKYNKTKKLLEVETRLDHEIFKKADTKQIIKMIENAVMSVFLMIGELKVENFDFKIMKNDVQLFFKELKQRI